MKMTRIGLVWAILISVAINVNAQNETDALRYSQSTVGGTSRFVSMGGAFGALGGDFSSLSYNPAGIAVYRKGEVSFSPSLFSQSTNSTYNGNSSTDARYNFNFGNAGFVLTNNMDNGSEVKSWKSISFGFGYNRNNNFNNRISIDGLNANSSLIDTYVNSTEGVSYSDMDQFSNKLAYDAYLIDNKPGYINSYKSVIPSGALLRQKKHIETSGAIGETVLSFGGNYNNKLYLGATIAFPKIRYKEETSYQELDAKDSITAFKSFNYTSNLTTKGNGINLKLGAIFRVTDWVRIGGAIHTPTFYDLNDSYSNKMDAFYDDTSKAFTSPAGLFDYRIITPMKLIGSLGFIIAKRGLIDVDYEYIDYRTAAISSNTASFSDINSMIRNKYQSAGNLRAGMEWRIDPFSIRMGYGWYGNPYKNSDVDASRSNYSVGFGIKQKGYYIDFAYILTTYSESYYLYDPNLVNGAKNDFTSSSFMTTLGFKF